MKRLAALILPACAAVLLATSVSADPATTNDQETSMTATGTFDVTMTPRDPEGTAMDLIGRLQMDKQYHGGLQATSQGQMLGCRTPVKGSAGYAAMEQVTGTLDGRSGSFVLMHSAIMDRGATGKLTAVVIPDSGTDELIGLAGELDIIVEGGGHRYEFRYRLDRE